MYSFGEMWLFYLLCFTKEVSILQICAHVCVCVHVHAYTHIHYLEQGQVQRMKGKETEFVHKTTKGNYEWQKALWKTERHMKHMVSWKEPLQ